MNKDMENTFNQMAELGGSEERLGRNTGPVINAPLRHKIPKPCGGCGATSESERCIGCLHDFGTQESAWVSNRPAPAATDTGLETVTYRGKFKAEGQRHWEYYPTPDSGFDPDKYEEQALCVRSQAEELLAAKDEHIEALREAGAADRKIIHDFMAIRDRLNADNKAKDARIKELEVNYSSMETQLAKEVLRVEALKAKLNTETQLRKDHQERNIELEANLAAAEQALDGIDWRSMFLNIHRRMKDGGESNAMAARWLSEEASKAVRAVLGEKPS